MTNKERIKELMKDYGQIERQAKAAFKKANDAHGKLWQSADGSAEAKKWNAEWKHQEAIGVSFREKANKILDRIERLKEENPRYLVTAKQKIVRDVDLGILEDKSAAKAVSRAKSLYAGKGYTGMKATKRNPRKASKKAPSPAQLRARAKFVAMVRAKSKASKKKAGKKPVRRNKTIITKPKKVVVINPATLKALYAKRAELEKQEEHCGIGRDGDAKREAIRRKLAALGDKIYKAEMEGRERARKAWQKNPAKSTRRKYRNGYLDLVIHGHAKKTPAGWSLGGKTFKQGKGIVPASRKGFYLDRATGTVFSKKARNGLQANTVRAHVRSMIHEGRSLSQILKLMRDSGFPNSDLKLAAKTYGKESAEIRGTGMSAAERKILASLNRKQNVAQGFFDGNGVFHPIRSSSDYSPGTAGETGRKPVRTRSKKRKTALKKAGQTARLKAETRKRKSTTSRLASRSLSRSAGILKGSGSRRQRKNPVINAGDSVKDRYGKWHRVYRVDGNSLWVATNKTIHINNIVDVKKARKKSAKNPSVKTIRKEFAGTLGKASQVFAPIGTPKNVAKLGKLLLIDTEKATIKPTGTVYLCADSKGKLHLCGSKNVPIYSGAAQSFGQVKKLEYETAKPHLYPGQGVINFWHKMGEESGNRPTLYADGKGGLKFRGGSYKITREGIVD